MCNSQLMKNPEMTIAHPGVGLNTIAGHRAKAEV